VTISLFSTSSISFRTSIARSSSPRVLQELGCRPEAAGMGIPDRLSNDYLRARGPGVQRLPSSAEPGVRPGVPGEFIERAILWPEPAKA
jgi:hypothetical protein